MPGASGRLAMAPTRKHAISDDAAVATQIKKQAM
jgi:hypothetical protein